MLPQVLNAPVPPHDEPVHQDLPLRLDLDRTAFGVSLHITHARAARA
ncbi:hypothetical protein [Bradyrhizobium yuanmingense]|nr:hypothetical protein [Bradyrhizobium yuanmingense]